MLELAFGALLIALIAWIFGFTGIARGAASAATFVFVLFLAIAAILLGLVILGVNLAL
ncbi:MAG: DUF1328 family protein [Vicinamibacteria bacterium]